MTHKFVTAKELSIDGTNIPAGKDVVHVTTELPLDRVIAGLGNGSLVLKQDDMLAEPSAKPKTARAKKKPAVDASDTGKSPVPPPPATS